MTVPTASTARVYDYLLGGNHHRQVDRDLAELVRARVPDIGEHALSSRRFLGRAVRACLDDGAEQFVDVGSGLPTVGAVHEVADAATPQRRARVVYVDHDPTVVAEARSILETEGDLARQAVVLGDGLDPASMWQQVESDGLIDVGRPIVLVMNALWHFIDDDAEPWSLVDEHRAHLPAGSWLVLSQMGLPDEVGRDERHAAAGLVQLYASIGSPARLRGAREVARFFGGWEMLPPGVTRVARWRPDKATPHRADPDRSRVIGGVARAPSSIARRD